MDLRERLRRSAIAAETIGPKRGMGESGCCNFHMKKWLRFGMAAGLVAAGALTASQLYATRLARAWFVGDPSVYLNAIQLEVGRSKLFIGNTNIVAQCNLGIQQKRATHGPYPGVRFASLQLNGRWCEGVLFACNPAAKSVVFGIPRSVNPFDQEYEYAEVQVPNADFSTLVQTVDAAGTLSD